MRFSRTVRRRSSWFALALLAAGTWAHAREVTDATGARVRVVDRPRRVVTLAPSLGEVAADVAGEDLGRIVGVSEYTDYPPALARTASIGSYAKFSLEKVVALKPDLVLATLDGNPRDQVLHLRELGLPVVVVETTTLKQVGESLEKVAVAMGDPARGAQLAAQFAKGLERLRERAKARTGGAPKVLLQVGDEPLVVVGRQSFLHEAIELIGAKNAYADAKAHYPRPSLEDAVKRNPGVVIALALGEDMGPVERMVERWQRFPMVEAVRAERVHALRADALIRPTLRLLEGITQLERTVFGERRR
jgi:iron complex transport system substrate-binding protein